MLSEYCGSITLGWIWGLLYSVLLALLSQVIRHRWQTWRSVCLPDLVDCLRSWWRENFTNIERPYGARWYCKRWECYGCLSSIVWPISYNASQTILSPICDISRIKCKVVLTPTHLNKLTVAMNIPSLSLRVFSDPSDPSSMWKKNIKDINGEILCVSQFTLLANTTKGNKPDFHRAMVRSKYNCISRLAIMSSFFQGGEQSRQMYSSLLDLLGKSYGSDKIKGPSIVNRQKTRSISKITEPHRREIWGNDGC